MTDGIHADSDGREFLRAKLSIYRDEDPALFALLVKVSPRRRSKLALATLRNGLGGSEQGARSPQQQLIDVDKSAQIARGSASAQIAETAARSPIETDAPLMIDLDGLGL